MARAGLKLSPKFKVPDPPWTPGSSPRDDQAGDKGGAVGESAQRPADRRLTRGSRGPRAPWRGAPRNAPRSITPGPPSCRGSAPKAHPSRAWGTWKGRAVRLSLPRALRSSSKFSLLRIFQVPAKLGMVAAVAAAGAAVAAVAAAAAAGRRAHSELHGRDCALCPARAPSQPGERPSPRALQPRPRLRLRGPCPAGAQPPSPRAPSAPSASESPGCRPGTRSPPAGGGILLPPHHTTTLLKVGAGRGLEETRLASRG